MRRRIAYFCFFLSSVFKGLGKFVITKEKTILVDALSLPGWFIIDNCLIYQSNFNDGKLLGFQWETFTLPDQWITQLNNLKRKV